MLKERIQEIFEFTKSESPYRKANKGWINQDIFLDLSPSTDNLKDNNEAAKITILWSPINSLLSNIFFILIIGSLIVFTSLSFVKGKFNINFFNTSLLNNEVKVEENKVLSNNEIKAFDTNDSKEKIDKYHPIDTLDDKKIDIDEEILDNKIDKQYDRKKDIESSKNVRILKNKKSKSNFI